VYYKLESEELLSSEDMTVDVNAAADGGGDNDQSQQSQSVRNPACPFKISRLVHLTRPQVTLNQF
jgi:hypothetical protein